MSYIELIVTLALLFIIWFVTVVLGIKIEDLENRIKILEGHKKWIK